MCRGGAGGSITYYLCLIMLVMLSLLAAGMSSARLAADRAVTASAAEQALFSEFAMYDRKLFDEYGLFFLDGGMGGSSLSLGTILDEINENAEYITNPRKGNPFGSDVLGIKLEKKKSAMTGYVLATDGGGAAFKRQICSQMTAQIGASAVSLIKSRLEEEKSTGGNIQSRRRNINSARSDEYYAEDQAGKTEAEKEAQAVPAESNPIDSVKTQKRKGLLNLVVPEGKQVSGASADLNSMVSRRELNRGIGMVPSEWEKGDGRILMLEYLVEEYPCFLDDGSREGLSYQVEYAIAGRSTDRDNLTAVLQRILAVREAANMVFLMSDSQKRAEADSLAAGIAALLLVPEAAPLISFILKLTWAYGESILDVRELLDGGRVPLLKTAASWQLQLSGLGNLSEAADRDRKSCSDGIDYREYLRLLLYTGSETSLADALMDLTEYNIRLSEPSFRLDNCIDALGIELSVSTGRMSFTAGRTYGYDME